MDKEYIDDYVVVYSSDEKTLICACDTFCSNANLRDINYHADVRYAMETYGHDEIIGLPKEGPIYKNNTNENKQRE